LTVGAALVELHVHGSQSLKQKRGVVKSILHRLRNHHNVSAAEVGGQETWQRAVLGISAVGLDEVRVRRSLERAVEFIDSLHLADMRASDIAVVELPYVLEEAGPVEGEERLPWEED